MADKNELPVGPGPVRVSIGLGYTKKVEGLEVWVKPSVMIEVEKPSGIALDDYLQMLSEKVGDELVFQEEFIAYLMGLGLKPERSDGR